MQFSHGDICQIIKTDDGIIPPGTIVKVIHGRYQWLVSDGEQKIYEIRVMVETGKYRIVVKPAELCRIDLHCGPNVRDIREWMV